MEKKRFLSSMQLKFALTYVVIIGAILALMNTYPLLVSQDLIFRSKQNSLQGQASAMASSLGVLGKLSTDGIEQVIALLDVGSLSRILVTDANGMVLYDTQEPDQSIGRYALYKEIAQALDGKDVFYSRFRGSAVHSIAAMPIYYRNLPAGAIYLYEYDTTQATLLRSVQKNLRSISLVICVLVTALSLVFSKAMTRRISELLRAIRNVREGAYSHRAVMNGSDELAQLASEFNQLAERIQTTEEVRHRFVSDASHELKTPLASIRLLTDSVLHSGNMDEATRREFLSDIGEEAERLSRITDRLLLLTRLDSKAEPKQVQPVDLKKSLESVLHLLTPLAEKKKVTLETSLGEDCVAAITEDALYQVAFNLIENAIKYNYEEGKVKVELERSGEEVVLRVSDTGIGIPEEDRTRIFERFYRVDKARSREAGGTGLGLSIVSETVRQFGGTVSVMAREEGGTCFIATFPAWKESGERP